MSLMIKGQILEEPVYLDCAATTPLVPEVREEVLRYLDRDFGNAGSRTHDYGLKARAVVEQARHRVADALGASRGDIVFTSGATESNNLALVGLRSEGERSGRRHIVTTAIEHHAVLEPLAELERLGFRVDRVRPDGGGAVRPEDIAGAVGPDTLAVSVMHVNNETGVVQPIGPIAAMLGDSPAIFHVDAAQGIGSEPATLRHPRIDLVSISGHKIHAPKGVGALVVRRRDGARPPLTPLMFGGGQERGLRPGTLPVALIAGLAKAVELVVEEHEERSRRCREFRRALLEGLAPLGAVTNPDPARTVPHILNIAIPGMESETVIEAWKSLVAISQGAACTSTTYTCSHVLGAMELPRWRQDGALRLSWCHRTPMPDTAAMVRAIERVREESEGVVR